MTINPALTTRYEFIHFARLGGEARKKTMIWSCRSNKDDAELGQIKWFGRWRQYCYFPTVQAVYSAGCLADIQKFMSQLTSDQG